MPGSGWKQGDDMSRLVLIAAALTVLVVTPSGARMSRAAGAGTACIKIEVFAANLAGQGGSSTPVSPAGLAKARALLKKAPRHPLADAAYFEEMTDGSSGVVFARKGCISAIWLAPAFMPKASLRAEFLGGRPSVSDPLADAAAASQWVGGLTGD